MIAIKLEKKDNYGISYDSMYISKEEFKLINDNDIFLKYIRLMKKIKGINKDNFIKSIYKILYEKSIEKVDVSNMKVYVNNYYKYVKVYKKHMIIYKDNSKNIINFYEKMIENDEKMDKNSIRYILHILYNEKMIKGKDILNWYNNLDKSSIFLKSIALKEFVEWLEGESEVSEIDESDNSHSDID